jgi:hypothetical protein
MNTEDLVVRLAREAAPVTPLHPPAVRLLRWLALTAACGVLGLVIYGLRADSATMTERPGFVRDVALGLVVLLAGGSAALVLAVPGAERRGAARWAAAAGPAVWILLVWSAVAEQGQGFTDMRHWPICAVRILSVALVPAIALILMVRRAAPLRPAWASGLAVAAATAGGALAIQLTCPIVDPGHVLLGHVAPVATFGALAAVCRAGLGDWV